MATHATVDDVADRLGRPLNAGEITQITAYLEDAETNILGKLPDALTKSGTDPVYSATLKAVECSIALRAARITDAVQAAYPNVENWSAPSGSSRANVTVLDTEWRQLGLTWYTSFSMSQNAAEINGELPPGFFSDMNPCWGPWWPYAED
jgi:hypothetical protein